MIAISLTTLRIISQHLNSAMKQFLSVILKVIAFGFHGFMRTIQDFMTNIDLLLISYNAQCKLLKIIGKNLILQKDRIYKCGKRLLVKILKNHANQILVFGKTISAIDTK